MNSIRRLNFLIVSITATAKDSEMNLTLHMS